MGPNLKLRQLDDIWLGRIQSNYFITLPGKHVLLISYNTRDFSSQSHQKLSINMKAGKTYEILPEVNLWEMKWNPKIVYKGEHSESTLNQLRRIK
jgi:hypothetical protein